MSGWDLTDSVGRLRQFNQAREWRKFHNPKDLAAALAIEAAELQELFLWRNNESAADLVLDKERFNRTCEELADVAVYLLLLADELDIDLAKAISAKVAANSERYSIAEHKGIAKKAG